MREMDARSRVGDGLYVNPQCCRLRKHRAPSDRTCNIDTVAQQILRFASSLCNCKENWEIWGRDRNMNRHRSISSSTAISLSHLQKLHGTNSRPLSN